MCEAAGERGKKNQPVTAVSLATIICLDYSILKLNPTIALFPGAQEKKNQRRAPSIHCSCVHSSPGFSGELGNYCDTSLCCTTILTDSRESLYLHAA